MLGWLIAAVFTAFIGTVIWNVIAFSTKQVQVNALPPLKVVQLLGNACLSPTTLAPKDPFRSRGPRWILLFSLFSEEPHWLIPNDLVGALGAMPAAWLATVSRRCHSVDVFQRGRFLFPRQPLTSLLPKSQLHRTRGRLSFKDRLQESSLVYLCRFGGLTERAEVLREKPA